MLRALSTQVFFILLLGLPAGPASCAQTTKASNEKPIEAQAFNYAVIDRKPLPRELFTQGLEIHAGELFVSSGGYNQSQLLRFDFASGKLKQRHQMDGRLFAEGLTILNNRIYQLTWRRRLGLVYNLDTLQPEAKWRLPGEGWGLTNNGNELIYSDGTDQLHFISPANGKRLRSISVRHNGKPVRNLNELEWIDGQVWANVWQTNHILLIDPKTGVATGSIDLSGLLPASQRRPDTDVLNGIAHNPANGQIWVTGKRWPWLYQIELQPAAEQNSATSKAISR